MTLGVDFLTKIVYIKQIDKLIHFNIWDTAGQEIYDSITRRYYKGADIAIICFSITDRNSYLSVPKWCEKIINECGKIPILITMTKIDLENEREVSFKEAIDFSYAMKCELFSVSSKNNIKVNELFEKIALIHIKNKNFDEVYCEFSLSKNQSLYSFSNKTFSNYNYYNVDNGSVNRGLESLEQEKSFKLKILKKDYNKGKEFNLKNKKNGIFCKI
jgi:small GTP-binding protein